LSTPYESATLLIRLYELRRDDKMREARAWFVSQFNPNSVDDIFATMSGPNSAAFRMVTSYWDMAASFVLNGAIDPRMFTDANGEQNIVFAKLQPFIEEYRTRMGNPGYYASLEKLVMQTPGMSERLAALRERFRPKS
jgi:hypothetical protein